MQKTPADSFTRLNTCLELSKKRHLAAQAIKAIPQTDFTFGRVESLMDKGLWYLPRAITGTTFINESYAKTQSFLERIFCKGDPRVQVAIDIYCQDSVENHKDLSDEKKKELQEFCIKQVSTKMNTDCAYIKKNFGPSVEITFPFFKQIYTEKSIQLEGKELLLLKSLLNVEAEEISLDHYREFCKKMLVENSGNIDILKIIIQKIIKHLEPELEEWTKVDV